MAATGTKAEQYREILKCGRDPEYFIKTYVKIQHPTQGNISFDTYPFQDSCIKAFEEHRLNIVLKSRQLGLSTICAGYAVWLAIFHKDKNILVIATKLKTAQNFIKKVFHMISNLPKWLLIPKFEPSKQQISFNNGSLIQAIPTSSDAGRSESLSLLIIDEAAFIRDFDDIWTGLSPTFSTGGRAIILSTPNGVGGQYYNLWTDAEAGQNGFNPIKIMWDEHPEHDQEWFDKETRNLPKKKISQEYMCDFIASGDTFLQANDLEEIRSAIKQPLEKHGDKRDVWVWVSPEPNAKYVISADVSRGDARDFSAFHIINIETSEVAVEYMGKTHPDKLAEMLDYWGKKYNTALIIPENNTFGFMVCSKLKNLKYKRLYYSSNRGDAYNYIPLDVETEQAGFSTNPKSRLEILSRLEEMIRNRQLKTYSQRLYDQLQGFVYNGNKPMAIKGGYDDLIMSIAIGLWMCEGGSAIGQQGMAMAYALLNATKVARKVSMPGEIESAQPLVNPQIKGFNPASYGKAQNVSQMRTFDNSDFSWLNS